MPSITIDILQGKCAYNMKAIDYFKNWQCIPVSGFVYIYGNRQKIGTNSVDPFEHDEIETGILKNKYLHLF